MVPGVHLSQSESRKTRHFLSAYFNQSSFPKDQKMTKLRLKLKFIIAGPLSERAKRAVAANAAVRRRIRLKSKKTWFYQASSDRCCLRKIYQSRTKRRDEYKITDYPRKTETTSKQSDAYFHWDVWTHVDTRRSVGFLLCRYVGHCDWKLRDGNGGTMRPYNTKNSAQNCQDTQKTFIPASSGQPLERRIVRAFKLTSWTLRRRFWRIVLP